MYIKRYYCWYRYNHPAACFFCSQPHGSGHQHLSNPIKMTSGVFLGTNRYPGIRYPTINFTTVRVPSTTGTTGNLCNWQCCVIDNGDCSDESTSNGKSEDTFDTFTSLTYRSLWFLYDLDNYDVWNSIFMPTRNTIDSSIPLSKTSNAIATNVITAFWCRRKRCESCLGVAVTTCRRWYLYWLIVNVWCVSFTWAPHTDWWTIHTIITTGMGICSDNTRNNFFWIIIEKVKLHKCNGYDTICLYYFARYRLW